MKVKNSDTTMMHTLLLTVLLSMVHLCHADSIAVAMPVADDDTVSYELPRPRDFNALRFTLDRHHRYQGDALSRGNTYLELGPGVTMIPHDNINSKVTPFTALHLRVGRQFGRLHSARLGFTGGVGYISSGLEGEGPKTLMSMCGIEADYLFSFSNYLSGYRPERPVDVSAFVGVGLGKYFLGGGNNRKTSEGLRESSMSYNLHAGMQLKIFAGPHAALTLEPFVALGNEGTDLSFQRTNWHRYKVSYGLNLSYVYYFNNVLTPPTLVGNFKKRYADGARWLRGDADDQAQRRPFFMHYGVGIAAYNTYDDLKWGKTIGPATSIGLGYWLSSSLGLRAMLSASNGNWKEQGEKIYKVGYTSVAVDALINPFGFSRHYNWESSAGLNLVAGYELGMLRMVNVDDNSGSYSMGYRLGLQPWIRMARGTRFYIEPLYTVMLHRQGDANRKRDDQFSLMAGVELLLHREKDDTAVADGELLPNGYFIGVGGGWNTAFRRWQYIGDKGSFFKNGILFGGYHFNEYHGVMISEEYLAEKMLTDDGEQKWKNWMTSLAYQLNISNLFTGYHPVKRWNVSLMAGPTVALNSQKARWGLHVGLQLDYRLSKHWGLFYQHRLYLMDRQLYAANQLFSQSVISSLNVGALYMFSDLVSPTVKLAKGAANGIGRIFRQQRRPFFVDYSSGVAWYPGMPGGGAGLGPSMQVSAGWWPIPAIGLRAGFNMAKGGALTVDSGVANTSEDVKTTAVYGALFADVLVNPLGFVSNYKWQQPWGVTLIGGLHKGLYAVEGYKSGVRGKNHYASGWRAGVQLWTRVQDDLRLFVEPMYTRLSSNDVYLDDATQSKVRQGAMKGYSQLGAKGAMSIRLGLTALLRHPKKRTDIAATPQTESRFFVALGGGTNFNLSRWNFANSGLNVNALLFGGYRLNAYHTLRAQAEYVSAGVAKGTETQRTNIGIFSLGYQLDLTTLMRGYQPQRRWDVGLFVGPSATVKGKVGFHAGVSVGYRLVPHWALFYHHTAYGIGDAKLFPVSQISGKLAVINTFNIGVRYDF